MRRAGAFNRGILTYHPSNPCCPEAYRSAEWERRVKQPIGIPLYGSGHAIPYLDKCEVPQGIRVQNLWRRKGTGGRGPRTERIVTHLCKDFGGAQPTAEDGVALVEFLKNGHFLEPTKLYGARGDATLLQVNADQVRLVLLAELQRLRCQVCGAPQPLRKPDDPCAFCHGKLVTWPDKRVLAHRAVRRIYEEQEASLVAREHTAQVPGEIRTELEEQFKAPPTTSRVNVLACSPTLEMGIDVGGLDAVILRNVPPRPDNYAQRGGRAGRRSRVGLVLGYARNTPHDQYFYDRPEEMIAGEVPAPLVPLGNRDVILRHLSAVAFGLADPGLAGRMRDYITPMGDLETAAIDALIQGVKAKSGAAVALCQEAWGDDILVQAGLDATALERHLDQLPDRIQDVFERTSRQVKELRKSLETFAAELRGQHAGTKSAQMVARLLGIPTEAGGRERSEADDRSAGYPLRRFAEFGILPGYEFPSEPATVRLLGDPNEEDAVSVERRFGIAQFQPGASIYARTVRWKVIGLDKASPWNPQSDEPGWRYRLCRNCELRYDSSFPRCPRCGSDEVGPEYPAFEYAGFVARPDEAPVLDEEERYATRNLVTPHPQWNGDVVGRWGTAMGWGLQLARREEIRWLNEGPTRKEGDKNGLPYLHPSAYGWLLCSSCGRILHSADDDTTRRTPRRAQAGAGGGRDDAYGHAGFCARINTPPVPVAIGTSTQSSVLRMIVPVPSTASEDDVDRWGLSLGMALRTGMRRHFLLDGSEVEFVLEGPWSERICDTRCRRISLSFVDPSLGGSGFLERMGNELHLVAKRAVEHLDHDNCETACYRCLKSYNNQRFHSLLSWPLVITDLEALAQEPPTPRSPQLGDVDDPKPWLEAYAVGVGSPLELKFLRLFEQHGFNPHKQVPVSPSPGEPDISVADFAVPERRLAIYIDGAAFHTGANLRRDRFIRRRLREGNPPWRVVELRAADLAKGKGLVEELMA
ncbi:MAG: helicase-related protein [Chloroflexota bacterium]